MTDRRDRSRWATDQPRFGVVGAGSWGTAIADRLARDGLMVHLWAREPEIVAGIEQDHRNPLFLDEVAEGVRTALAARRLSREHGVEMPITEQICAVVHEGEDPLEALTDLTTRDPRDERATPASRESDQ